jgi:PAS domain-containing protein
MNDAVDTGAGLRRLELALQAAGLGEFQWDLDTNTLLISARMAAITGFPEGETTAQIGELIETRDCG